MRVETKRNGVSALIAVGIVFGLFMLMQILIALDSRGLKEEEGFRIADVIMPEVKPEVISETEVPDRPDAPEEPPPDINFDVQPEEVNLNIGSYSPKVKVDTAGGLFRDGEYLPIFKVPPQYPRRAAERGIEGYVILRYTVTATGTVRNPVVVESQPPKIFDQAAIRASLKNKYKPKVVNGKAVDVDGVLYRIIFELEKSTSRRR